MIVNLTPQQKEIYDLYVKEGLNQQQIAVKLFGNKNQQGRVSKQIIALNKKLGVNLCKEFPKTKNLSPFDIDMSTIKHIE